MRISDWSSDVYSSDLLDTSSHTPPLFIAGNAQLLAQAIGNLLDNAIKYTPEDGSVSLRLEAIDRHATLTLTDTGPGIQAESRDKVLQRFDSLDSRDRKSKRLKSSHLCASIIPYY